MKYNEKSLVHGKKSFERETLLSLQQKRGFNNLGRMELFLWDLELYLQIQNLLKDKIALKGGAAAQFYLPVDYQRTSVDIDIICSVKEEDIKKCLLTIEENFDGENDLFKFKLHKPKKIKTELPLHTYLVNVPSICSDSELFGKQPGVQEVKVEFFITNELLEINQVSSPSIFAVETDQTYQILPLNSLLGDKLTTLGPNTIGIPLEREDEQMKQIYDIDALLQVNWEKVDFSKIKKYFFHRAEIETTCRGIEFDLTSIVSDMLSQLNKLSFIDMEGNDPLRKLLNDFQSLYLRKSAMRNMWEWAILAAKLYFFLDCLLKKEIDKGKFIYIFAMEEKLKFSQFQGEARGEAIRRFKESFINEFGEDSFCRPEILKGKHPQRILWAILTTDNLENVNSWINNFE